MKTLKKILKSLGVGAIAVIFVTIGINAADNYDNISQSIVGRLILGKNKGPCPDDMAYVPKENGGFCIDKYESSPSNDCSYKNVTDQIQSRDNLDSVNCSAQSVAGKEPWRFISQTQAQTACAKAGKRLPTNEEWYLASLGTPDKNPSGTDDCQIVSNWMSQPGLTGSGVNCVSSYGAFDMIGNVWEWVKGEANEGIFESQTMPESGYIKAVDTNGVPIETDLNGPEDNYNKDYFWIKNSDIRGLARGGYWQNGTDAGVYAMYMVSPPNFAETGIGFRCAK